MRIIFFTRFHRRKNRGSLAIFFAEEIAHLGASKSRAIFPAAVKIAAATAENRAILVHSDADTSLNHKGPKKEKRFKISQNGIAISNRKFQASDPPRPFFI